MLTLIAGGNVSTRGSVQAVRSRGSSGLWVCTVCDAQSHVCSATACVPCLNTLTVANTAQSVCVPCPTSSSTTNGITCVCDAGSVQNGTACIQCEVMSRVSSARNIPRAGGQVSERERVSALPSCMGFRQRVTQPLCFTSQQFSDRCRACHVSLPVRSAASINLVACRALLAQRPTPTD